MQFSAFHRIMKSYVKAWEILWPKERPSLFPTALEFNILGFVYKEGLADLKESPPASPMDNKGSFQRFSAAIFGNPNVLLVFEATTSPVEWQQEQWDADTPPCQNLRKKLLQLERQICFAKEIYNADLNQIFCGLYCYTLRHKHVEAAKWISQILRSHFAQCIPLLVAQMKAGRFGLEN